MPHQYDFVCQDCKKPFSKILTLAEYEKGRIVCPKCGSRKVEQQVFPFYTVISKSSQSPNEDSRRLGLTYKMDVVGLGSLVGGESAMKWRGNTWCDVGFGTEIPKKYPQVRCSE